MPARAVVCHVHGGNAIVAVAGGGGLAVGFGNGDGEGVHPAGIGVQFAVIAVAAGEGRKLVQPGAQLYAAAETHGVRGGTRSHEGTEPAVVWSRCIRRIELQRDRAKRRTAADLLQQIGRKHMGIAVCAFGHELHGGDLRSQCEGGRAGPKQHCAQQSYRFFHHRSSLYWEMNKFMMFP